MNIRHAIIFFGILISLSSCKEIDPNKQIDEGKFENNRYISKEIGWTIVIPENWKIVSKEQNEAYEKKGLDAIGERVDEDIDASEVRNLIGFQKDIFNMFQSTSEPFELEYPGEWEENDAAIKGILYYTYENEGIKVDTTATQIVQINGLDFHSYEFRVYSPSGELIISQLLYNRLINGYDFGVIVNYNNESDKQEILDAWLNSKFSR